MARRGLPAAVPACRLDPGGVLTGTAGVLAPAWRAVRAAGWRTAAGSSGANPADVHRTTGPAPLPEARLDGVVARQRGPAGDPAPGTSRAGAADPGVGPQAAAVFQDALSGVSAGRAGTFRFVIGVDRVGNGHGAALRGHGADIVVTDLAQLLDDGRARIDDDPHP